MEMPLLHYLKRMGVMVGAGVAACGAVFATEYLLSVSRLTLLLTSVVIGAVVFGCVTVLAGGSVTAMLARFSTLTRRR
jgi:hypothetical protein